MLFIFVIAVRGRDGDTSFVDRSMDRVLSAKSGTPGAGFSRAGTELERTLIHLPRLARKTDVYVDLMRGAALRASESHPAIGMPGSAQSPRPNAPRPQNRAFDFLSS
jgi:hypothetical protein